MIGNSIERYYSGYAMYTVLKSLYDKTKIYTQYTAIEKRQKYIHFSKNKKMYVYSYKILKNMLINDLYRLYKKSAMGDNGYGALL